MLPWAVSATGDEGSADPKVMALCRIADIQLVRSRRWTGAVANERRRGLIQHLALQRPWTSPSAPALRPGGTCLRSGHGAERNGVARRVDGRDTVLPDAAGIRLFIM